eukprot:158353_1
MLLSKPEMSVKQTNIGLAVVTSIYLIILSPMSLYYGYSFWKFSKQNIAFFTKRHTSLVLVEVILLNVFIAIIRTSTDFLRLNQIIGKYGILSSLLLNLMQFYPVLILIRLWLLYYDYNYGLQTISIKWKSQITKQQKQLPWTLRYKWMGNLKILTIIATSICTILMLLILLSTVFFRNYLSFMQLIGALFLIMIIIIGFKIRKCRDELLIQREFLITGIVLVIFCVVPYVSIGILIPDITSNNRIIPTNLVSAMLSYLPCFISTYWAIKQYNKQKLIHMMHRNIDYDDNKHLSLAKILSNKDGFDLFANHLVKEFSGENLFFIVEVIQLKNDVIAQKLVSDAGITISIDLSRINKIRTNEGHIDNIYELKKRVRYITEQYICSGSEYCINIASTTKMKILRNSQTLTEKNNTENDIELTSVNNIELIKEYVTIFDRALEEILSLLKSDSLMRFYRSRAYQNFAETLK